MFLLREPSKTEITRFISSVSGSNYSYRHVGATLNRGAPGYTADHNRILIGKGQEDSENAKRAIRDWKMFDLPWLRLCWTNTPIEVGQTVAIVVNHFGFWSMSATRIVYVIDEPNRFGFAYGTLFEHVESGEERFSVEVDPKSGEVWYDLFAFSKPNHLFARLGYPISRRLQKRFARDSMAAMKRAVEAC